MLVRALLPLVLLGCAAHTSTVHTFTSGPEGFDTSTYWIDTGREVVVVDAQFTPELAQAMLDEIHAQTDSPVRWVVVTHPSPDKFNGAAVFQADGAELVVSASTARALEGVHAYKKAYFEGIGTFEPGTYPALPVPDRTFEDSLKLEVRGGAIDLRTLSHPAVTGTQTVVVLDRDRLFVGDLAGGNAHLWLEGDVSGGTPTPDIEGWIAALSEVEALAPDGMIHPGRGAPFPASQLVEDHTDYLIGMREVVSDYLATLEDPAAALSGPGAGDHYAAIATRAEARFPGRDHAYLVEYGIYGMALQEAQR